MPRKISEFGKKFREKFSYYGKLTKECMGKELWNEYYKIWTKKFVTSSEHQTEIAERKIKRSIETIKRRQQREKDGEQYFCYCRDIKEVENFYEAQKENFKGWVLHHKLEQMFTAYELQAMGIYFNCKPGELIFLKVSEHNNNLRLHFGCRIRYMSKNGRKNEKNSNS